MNRKRRNIVLFVFALAAVSVILFGLLTPYGSRIHVVAEVKENSVEITKLALKKNYAISVLDPEDAISSGNRTINMRIFFNQTEILETRRCSRSSIGIGDCVLDSTTLPSNLEINSLLTVKIELCDLTGRILASDENTIVYK